MPLSTKEKLEIEKLQKEIRGMSTSYNWFSKAAAFAPLLVALAAIFYGYKSNLFETKERELSLRKAHLQYEIDVFKEEQKVLFDTLEKRKQELIDTLQQLNFRVDRKVDTLRLLRESTLQHLRKGLDESRHDLEAVKGMYERTLEARKKTSK